MITWREIAADPDALREALADPAVNPPPVPWMMRVLAGAGAWIAGCFLIGSLTTCLGSVLHIESRAVMTGGGLVLLAGSIALRVLLPGIFVSQLALSLGATGQLLLAAGLGGLVGTQEHAVIWMALSAALVVVHPDPVQRFVSVNVGLCALTYLLLDAQLRWTADLLVAVTTVLLMIAWSLPTRRWLSAARPPVVTGLLCFLFAIHVGMAVVETFDRRDKFAPFLAAPVVVTLALLVAIFRVFHARGGSIASEIGALTTVACIALAALTQGKPGILAALLGMVLGFARHDRLLVALSTVFCVVFGVHFYYDLALSLYTKSGILVGSGVLLLAVRGYLHVRRLVPS